MNNFKKYFGLAFILVLSGCDKEEKTMDFTAENPAVDTFVQLLKANRYNSPELPAFKYIDIPGLLKYRTDTTTITVFPVNPISSFGVSESKAGMVVLWTIESIRLISIDSTDLISRFPSFTPFLGIRNYSTSGLLFDNISHRIAAKAYYDWWMSNENYDKIKNVDPLGNTDYMWH